MPNILNKRVSVDLEEVDIISKKEDFAKTRVLEFHSYQRRFFKDVYQTRHTYSTLALLKKRFDISNLDLNTQIESCCQYPRVHTISLLIATFDFVIKTDSHNTLVSVICYNLDE